MNSAIWRKYASRFFLLIIMIAFIGCEEGESCEGPPDVCGETIQIKKGFAEPIILTDSNPSFRLITDDACALGGFAEFTVQYQYHDIPIKPPEYTHTEGPGSSFSSSTPAIRQGTEKDKPSITVKFGTIEDGVHKDANVNKPGFVNGEWVIRGTGGPRKVKEGTKPAPIHYVLTVTLQRPLIRLPGKTPPTIALPFIGQVIGPKPRDVDVHIYLSYTQPLPEKPAK